MTGEMDMSGLIRVFCVLAMGMLAMTGFVASAEDSVEYTVGDEWVYSMTMEIDPMTLTGTFTYIVEGVTTETVAGVTYDVYDLALDGSMSIEGGIENFTIDGSATITGSYSMDIENLDEIRSETNLSLEMDIEGLLSAEMWEYTLVTYSPPGGVGDVPEDPEEGDSWVVTYTAHSESMSFDSMSDLGIETASESETETRTYTYVRTETVTVPAGTFECEVVQIDDGDSIETRWECEEVGAYVKSVFDSDSTEDTEMVLESYSYAAGEADDDDMTLYVIIGAVAAVAVVVAVVALMMLKKRPSVPQTMPPAEPGAAPSVGEPPVPPPQGGTPPQ